MESVEGNSHAHHHLPKHADLPVYAPVAEPHNDADRTQAGLDEKNTSTPASLHGSEKATQDGAPLERTQTTGYAHGVKLAGIVLAICLSMFLVALDVSTCPHQLTVDTILTSVLDDNLGDRDSSHYRRFQGFG